MKLLSRKYSQIAVSLHVHHFFLYKNRLHQKIPNINGQSRLISTKYTDLVIYMCTEILTNHSNSDSSTCTAAIYSVVCSSLYVDGLISFASTVIFLFTLDISG